MQEGPTFDSTLRVDEVLITGMTVAQLKAKCKEHHLSTGGNKAALAERVRRVVVVLV